MSIDLNKIVKGLQKNYSACNVADNIVDTTDCVSTGNKAFDLISDGGVPWGYVAELLGLSASGKSLFICQMISDGQAKYKAIGLLIDRENAYTNQRGEQLGIDNSRLILAKPADVPIPLKAFEFIQETVGRIRKADANARKADASHEDTYIVIAIDSIAAFGKDVGILKADPGRKAKAIHEGLREMLSIIDNRIVLLIANQVTYKVGMLFGDPKTSTAGESVKYYSTIRFALEDKRKIIDPKKGNEVVGNWIGVEVIKTRHGPCYRTCFLKHLYDTGIDYYSGYARLLVKRGYLKPTNEKEFNKFKQSTVTYMDGADKKEVSEFAMEKFVEEHTEFSFDSYPEYNEKDI